MKRIGRPRGDNNLDKSYTIRMDDATHSRLEMYSYNRQEIDKFCSYNAYKRESQ